MDNARKKYVNIERLSSGDIFTLLSKPMMRETLGIK